MKTPLENRPISFDVRARYYGGAYIARCNGCTASSTNRAAVAAESAAKKHAAKIPVPATWTLVIVEVTPDLFIANFMPPEPKKK